MNRMIRVRSRRTLWVCVTLALAVVSPVQAGIYGAEFTKWGRWRMAVPPGTPMPAAGTYEWFEHTYVEDPCTGGAAFLNEPGAQPPPANGRMVGVPGAARTRGVSVWGLAGGFGPAAPTAIVLGRPHAGASASMSFSASPLAAGAVNTRISAKVYGDTSVCPNGATYSEAIAEGLMSVPCANLVAVGDVTPLGVVNVHVPAANLLALTVAGDKINANARAIDPVQLSLLDTVTGQTRTEDVFHMDIMVESHEMQSEFQVDPITGDWFISAPDGSAYLEYAFTGDWVAKRSGGVSVINGELSLSGELAGLPWIPSTGLGRSGAPGWYLSHEYVPSWEAEVVADNLVPGRTYIPGYREPAGVEGQTASIPEPATLIFLALGGYCAFWRRTSRSL